MSFGVLARDPNRGLQHIALGEALHVFLASAPTPGHVRADVTALWQSAGLLSVPSPPAHVARSWCGHHGRGDAPPSAGVLSLLATHVELLDPPDGALQQADAIATHRACARYREEGGASEGPRRSPDGRDEAVDLRGLLPPRAGAAPGADGLLRMLAGAAGDTRALGRPRADERAHRPGQERRSDRWLPPPSCS